MYIAWISGAGILFFIIKDWDKINWEAVSIGFVVMIVGFIVWYLDYNKNYKKPEKKEVKDTGQEKEENEKRYHKRYKKRYKKEKAKAKAKAKALAEFWSVDYPMQQQRFKNALESQKNTAGFKTIDKFEDIDDGKPYLIDTSFTKKIWGDLANLTSQLLLGEEDENADEKLININKIFDSCIGISVILPGDIMFSRQEFTDRDGARIYVENTDGKQNYLKAIKAANSLDALVEGFYIAQALPNNGVSRRNPTCPGRRFILDNDSFFNCIRKGFGDPTGVTEINKINCPSGLRVIKTKDGFRVSCLAHFDGAGISDVSILIREGLIEVCPHKEMLDIPGYIFY